MLFYHLERDPLDRVLPALLEKCLARRLRSAVETATVERAGALNAVLWTYRDESFLPHGLAERPDAAEQPIVIAADTANPNGATVRFYVDGAEPAAYAEYDRCVYLFDGHEAAAVARARDVWRQAKSQGCTVTYWQQDAAGRWNQRA